MHFKKIIESQDEHGWSLVTVAIYNNNVEMAKWLIENGSDINVLNNNGTTLLMYAKNCYLNTGDSTLFELLLDKGLNPSLVDYYGLTLKDYCEKDGISVIGNIEVATL